MINLARLLIKGKSPLQFFDALYGKLKITLRSFFLSVQRKFLFQREKKWIEDRGEIRTVLNFSEYRQILLHHPEAHSDFIQEAEKALSGWTEVPGFGNKQIQLKPDPSSSREEAYSFRLLCRLDFIRPLVRTILTVENASPYVEAVERVLMEWEEARRCHYRWNSVDDAIRVLMLIETLLLLREKIKPEVYHSGIRTLLDSTWAVQSRRTRTGNHLIYEGLALFYAGSCLCGYHKSACWKKLGKHILEKAMADQIFADGMNAEMSANYHLITGANFLKAWVMGKKTGAEFSPAFCRKLAKMILQAERIRSCDGGFFAVGDSDRMAGKSREEREGRALAELGAILNGENRDSFLSLELEMLLAGLKPQVLAEIQKKETLLYACAGGYYILSNPSGNKLLFDVGPFGLSGASHHGHADSLAFEVHFQERRFLVDSGGFSYVDEEARAFARSTLAHNTVEIDELNSSEITGSFSFGRGANSMLIEKKEVSEGIILTAEHDGYTRLPSPVIHRRAIFWSTRLPLFLLVADYLIGEGVHQAQNTFHGDFDWEAQIEGANCAVWSANQGRVIQKCWSSAPIKMTIQKGVKESRWQGWVSPSFGDYRPAPVLAQSMQTAFPCICLNVFYAGQEPADALKISQDGCSIQLNQSFTLNWEWVDRRFKVDFS